jgi:hypothetical protein
MRLLILVVPALLLGPPALEAQSGVPPAAAQIAAAVLPLPEEFRESATVLGYRAGQEGLVELRRRDGAYVCLADSPAEERFHVACYHRSLEPFMARGRELRSQGVARAQLDSIRNAEALAGTLAMPAGPASLYSLTGGSYDAESGSAPGARLLFVIYVPFATTESTGISTRPSPTQPWLMDAGTPKAHIMFTPQM